MGENSGGFKDTIISIGTCIAVSYFTGGMTAPTPTKKATASYKDFAVSKAWKKGVINAIGSATSGVNYMEVNKA